MSDVPERGRPETTTIMTFLFYHAQVPGGPGDSWPVSSLILHQAVGEGEISAG